jgi:hypothetical protein
MCAPADGDLRLLRNCRQLTTGTPIEWTQRGRLDYE